MLIVGFFTGTAERKIVENNSNDNVTSVVENEENITTPIKVEQKVEINKDIEKIVEEYKKNPDLNLTKSIESLPNIKTSSGGYKIGSKWIEQTVIRLFDEQELVRVDITGGNIDNILSSLGNDFQAEEIARDIGAFKGNITKDGFIKLLNDPNVDVIEIPKIVSALLDYSIL